MRKTLINLCYNIDGDKMKKLTKSLLLISLVISLVACSKSKLSQYKETTFDVGFNTPFTLIAYTESQEKFNQLFEAMKDEVRMMNKLFDIYSDYKDVNNIKTINDNAGIKPIKVDKQIIDLLIQSKVYTDKTDSKFDPTLGPVLKIWHLARETGMQANQENKPGKSPSQAILEEANNFVGWEFVEIDEDNSTVYLNNERASLDLGAISKGYAVEQVAKSLEAKGVEYGVVNGGGNVRTIGSKLDNDPWVVGVTNPDNINNKSVMSLGFDNSMSIVTSGDYERFFVDEEGNHQHHLIDSTTLQPARISRSITVTTKDSTMADILSTAFSMTPLDQAKEFSEKLNLDDLGLVWIFDKKQDNEDFHFTEVEGKFVYYNDVIKENIYTKK